MMKTRKLMTDLVIWLMSITRDEPLVNYWVWEMTPMPAGLPSWRQIRVGLAMVLGMDFVARAYLRAVEREEEEIIAALRLRRLTSTEG